MDNSNVLTNDPDYIALYDIQKNLESIDPGPSFDTELRDEINKITDIYDEIDHRFRQRTLENCRFQPVLCKIHEILGLFDEVVGNGDIELSSETNNIYRIFYERLLSLRTFIKEICEAPGEDEIHRFNCYADHVYDPVGDDE